MKKYKIELFKILLLEKKQLLNVTFASYMVLIKKKEKNNNKKRGNLALLLIQKLLP